MCQGQLSKARETFDSILEDNLQQHEITKDPSVNGMLPPYLITLLTYFYLKTKNYKMARSLVKCRRFVVDQDFIS